MKKQILLLFIFCSILIQAQIQIPQVVGLPSALNSKVDKITGKSLIADTLSAKIQPHVTNLSNPHGVTKVQVGLGNVDNTSDVNKPISTATQTALNTKEPLLPPTPSNPESRFLNGNKQWAEIVLGSGGYASNVYFTNLTSTIVGSYKQTSGTHELTETIASGTCNNNEVLIHTYLFEQPVGITTVDAGVWRFTMNSKINSNVGDSKFKIVQFKRSSTGVETDMFTIYSNTIENTDYQNFIIETIQPSFLVDSLDRFGCRIYATTTTTVNKTISYKVGDGYASYLNTPLALRHPQLRDPNGNPNVQHLTAAQVYKVDATSGTNTGDETLTSIKTKLGAATAFSDGYLKYQDWSIFNSKEPSFSKNTGFNLPLGTTTGTVLEGRTFGTAANSAVVDFQPIENQRLSTTNSPNFVSGSFSGGVTAYNTSSDLQMLIGNGTRDIYISGATGAGTSRFMQFSNVAGNNRLSIYEDKLLINSSGSATFSSTVNSTGFLLNGNNLTSSLSTNYIPKWNGSSMVNSLISDNGNNTQIGAGTPFTTGAQLNIIGTSHGLISQTSGGWGGVFKNTTTGLECDIAGVGGISVQTNGRIVSTSTTQSTLPTTGALVVNGGIGADHVRANNFYGNGSTLTGIQLPITLTTNGTSGAATFENGVMNVPNYTQSATGSSYSCTFTNILNTSLSLGLMSDYATVGNVISIAIHGGVSSTGSGKCTFRLSLPTAASPSYKFVVTASDASKTTGRNIFVESTASNYVDVSFLATAAGEVIEFTIVGNGHQ